MTAQDKIKLARERVSISFIVEAFRAALEDANFHTFNAAVGEAWELEIKRWDEEAA